MSILNYFVVCFLALYQFQNGQAGIADRPRIIGGSLASPGEIKYIVVTLHDDKHYACGGAIIDNYYVLSAAHCFINDENKFDDKKITVVAGTNDYNNEDDPRRVEVEVEKLYIPKDFDGKTFYHDIALLKLKESLNISKNDLEKLSLPTTDRNVTDHMALMAGFGYDEHEIFLNSINEEPEDVFTATGLLRKADIKIFSNDACQKLYPKEEIFDSFLCGKMVKKSQRREYGICNGDSGSPLVVDSKEVVGLVSWSDGCDEREIPLVYTRVHSFLDFIKNAKKDKTENMRVKIFK